MADQWVDRRKEVRAAMRRASMDFESANISGDLALDLAQFSVMINARVGREVPLHQVKAWFELLTNGRPVLTIDVFFCFCVFDISTKIGSLEQ
jgi:hypothetical protein